MNNVVVILPIRNVEKMIESTLSSLDSRFWGRISTLIVIDNASTDKTVQIVSTLAVTDPHSSQIEFHRNSQNLGYGGSIKLGLSKAKNVRANWALVMHGDDQTSWNTVMNELLDNLDVSQPAIWTTRFSEKILTKGYSKSRRSGNLFFIKLSRFLTGQEFTDPGSAICALNLDFLELCPYQKFTDGLHFHPQLNLYLSVYLKQPPTEVPMYWKDATHRIKFSLIKYGLTLLLINIKFFVKSRILGKHVDDCF